MKPIFLALLCVLMLIPVALCAQDEPSTYDQCRMIMAKDLADPKAPLLSEYPAKDARVTNKPKIDLRSNPIARTYRTVLRRGIAKGPNFAGHYRVIVWGCGSSCALFAVVNLKTGAVITPNESGTYSVEGLFLAGDTDGFLKDASHGEWSLRYKTDSRLLVVLGMLQDSREGAFYYEAKGDRLILTHSTIVKKNCGDPPR